MYVVLCPVPVALPINTSTLALYLSLGRHQFEGLDYATSRDWYWFYPSSINGRQSYMEDMMGSADNDHHGLFLLILCVMYPGLEVFRLLHLW